MIAPDRARALKIALLILVAIATAPLTVALMLSRIGEAKR